MSATPTGKVYIDRLSDLSMQERHGTVIAITRKAVVKGLTGIDYSIMLNTLKVAGVPASGEVLAAYPYLVLTDRSVLMVDVDTAEVTLGYTHFMNDGQNLTTPPVGLICGKVRASVSQKTVNFYYDKSGNRKDIELTHKYPATDEKYGGQTLTQTGEVTVMVPEKTINVEGVLDTPRPWLACNKIIGAINKSAWSCEAAGTWMCTEAAWEALTNTRYKVGFQFQCNLDGWNPTAVFIDDRTGKPPIGLVKNKGYLTVEYHKEVDFDTVLGTKLQGG